MYEQMVRKKSSIQEIHFNEELFHANYIHESSFIIITYMSIFPVVLGGSSGKER